MYLESVGDVSPSCANPLASNCFQNLSGHTFAVEIKIVFNNDD